MPRNRDNRAGSQAHADFLCAMIRNYTKQVRAGGLVDAQGTLAHLRQVEREVEEQKALIVLELHARGLSWQEIGAALGMDRSAAYNKYVGRVRVDRVLSDDNSGTRVG